MGRKVKGVRGLEKPEQQACYWDWEGQEHVAVREEQGQRSGGWR